MSGLHDLHDLLSDSPGILLADELGECALKIGKTHELRQLGRMGIGENSAVGNYNDAAADLFNNFEHMRDVENGLALRSKQFKEIFEEPCRNHVEPGEWLVEKDVYKRQGQAALGQ